MGVRIKLNILPIDNEEELKARLRREIYRWSNTLKNKRKEGVAVADYLNPEKSPIFLIAQTLKFIVVASSLILTFLRDLLGLSWKKKTVFVFLTIQYLTKKREG